MRQVDEAELVWKLKYALRRMSRSRRLGFAANDPAAKQAAEQMMAQELAYELRNYEILSETAIREETDLFSAAAYGKH